MSTMKGVRTRKRVDQVIIGDDGAAITPLDPDKEFDTIDANNSFKASLTPSFVSSPVSNQSNIER